MQKMLDDSSSSDEEPQDFDDALSYRATDPELPPLSRSYQSTSNNLTTKFMTSDAGTPNTSGGSSPSSLRAPMRPVSLRQSSESTSPPNGADGDNRMRSPLVISSDRRSGASPLTASMRSAPATQPPSTPSLYFISSSPASPTSPPSSLQSVGSPITYSSTSPLSLSPVTSVPTVPPSYILLHSNQTQTQIETETEPNTQYDSQSDSPIFPRSNSKRVFTVSQTQNLAQELKSSTSNPSFDLDLLNLSPTNTSTTTNTSVSPTTSTTAPLTTSSPSLGLSKPNRPLSLAASAAHPRSMSSPTAPLRPSSTYASDATTSPTNNGVNTTTNTSDSITTPNGTSVRPARPMALSYPVPPQRPMAAVRSKYA